MSWVAVVAAVGVAIGATGTAVSVQGAKNVAKVESQIAQQNANRARDQAVAAQEKQDREKRLRLGANIASAGASGVGISSFGEVLSDNAAQEELDLLTLQSEGLLRENDLLFQSSVAKTRGETTAVAGGFSTASSVLGGASSFIKNKPTTGTKT